MGHGLPGQGGVVVAVVMSRGGAGQQLQLCVCVCGGGGGFFRAATHGVAVGATATNLTMFDALAYTCFVRSIISCRRTIVKPPAADDLS